MKRLSPLALLIAAAAACGAPGEEPALESATAAAGARPDFQLPLPCGQTWEASTYGTHWPDSDSIDLGRWSGSTNISDGEPVLASAAGTVLEVFDDADVQSPDRGNAIYLDHGGGWVTHYMHLKDVPTLAVGDFVARGQQLGRVGQTGGANGESHLHYTQLADGAAVRIAFDGVLIGSHAGTVGNAGTTWGDGEALTAGDADADGICDTIDLCDGSANNLDMDGDGIGNACDLCPADFDTTNLDSDNDGVPNACDTCPSKADASNLDTDGDGKGDVCDSDDDGDMCLDGADQHPKDAEVVVGTVLLPNCSPSSAPQLGSEAGDTDGDGLRDCADADDDNDGILDSADPCPINSGSLCVFPGPSCPFAPIRFTCRGGGCNQQLLRVEQVINPDPTTTMLFEIVSIERDEIVVAPLRTRSVTDSIQALRGSAALPSGRRVVGAAKMEIVSSTGRVVADLATYLPSSLRVGTMTGTQVVVKLGAGGVQVLGR